jgi:hypothetical protein
MTTRRELLTAAVALAPLALAMKTTHASERKAAEMADFLFVQNARAVAYADGRLVLEG